MRALRAFLLRIRGVLRREDASRDFSEQIHADIELHIEDAIRSGMSREDARRTALLKFGGIDSATEAWRDRHGLPFLETFLRDVRYALRVLTRNKGWSAVAVASLALGVGANAAMFSAANRLLLRKLPVPEADRLVTLQWQGENKAMTSVLDYGYVPGGALGLLADNKEFTVFDIRAGATGAYETFRRMHDANHTLTHLFAAVGGPTVNLIVDGHGDTASSQFVSGEFYTALGIPPAAGRTLLPTDDQKGAPPVAVLGHGYWRRRFGGDRAIVGKQVRVNTVALTIVGVSGISSPDPISSGETYDIAIPLAAERNLQAGESRLDDPLSWWLVMMGRMKPGVTAAQVEADLAPVYEAAGRDAVKGMVGKLSEKDRKEAHEFGFGERIPHLHVVSGARGAYEPVPLDSTALVILAVLVGLVLLAVCANLANLSLAATTSREREIAVRRAIGASRRRLIGQILTEHIVVAFAGGTLSLLVAYLLQDLVRLRIPTQFDWTVVGFAFAVSAATGIAIGVLPALRASRFTEGIPASGVTSRRSRFASALLVSQVLLSTVLLIGAGLFLRTLVNLKNIDPGFETGHLVLFTIDPKFSQYDSAKTEALYAELLAKLGALPGVSSASFSDNSLLGNGFNGTEVYGGGAAGTPRKQFAYKVAIQQDFFKTMGIPLRHGRPFDLHDVAKAPQVAIINESLARALFGDANAVGKRFSGDKDSPPDTEIVGVVADTRHRTLREAPRPMVFIPHLQAVVASASTDEVKSSTSASGARTFEVRTSVPAETLMGAIQQVVRAEDPSLPIIQLSTQATALAFHWAQERAIALASATFGGLTLVVTMIGLFGLMSYVVARRTKEIAIRMALGAKSGGVLLSVLGEALSVVGIGIVAGLGVALATTRFLKTQLFGLSPTDPLVIGAAILTMLVVSAVAAYIPARRAARVAPMVALRED